MVWGLYKIYHSTGFFTWIYWTSEETRATVIGLIHLSGLHNWDGQSVHVTKRNQWPKIAYVTTEDDHVYALWKIVTIASLVTLTSFLRVWDLYKIY